MAAQKKRKPHGEGKLALQRVRRQKLASWLADKLVKNMDVTAAEESGTLFPRSVDFKKKKIRKAYGFLRELGGRVYTNKVCMLACRILLQKLPFRVNYGPRVDQETYLAQQCRRLKLLSTKSKRFTVKMDNAETQAYVVASFSFFLSELQLRNISASGTS